MRYLRKQLQQLRSSDILLPQAHLFQKIGNKLGESKGGLFNISVLKRGSFYGILHSKFDRILLNHLFFDNLICARCICIEYGIRIPRVHLLS